VSVLPFPRRTREVAALSEWVVQVFPEALNGHQNDVSGARFDTEAEANGWAVEMLERLRITHAEQLGGPDCRCYVATVRAPGREPRRAYLFSTWEPVEWDGPADAGEPGSWW
jgi:hypothetical protein